MAEFIRPSFEILTPIDEQDILTRIEQFGRVCYKSEEKITEDSALRFAESIIKRGHLSVIEHVSISVRFICDRGVSHEIVRHRLASYSQESSRYCDYNKKGVQFIIPCWSNILVGRVAFGFPDINYDASEVFWITAMLEAERYYQHLRELGWKPEQARSVLPNSLKTELVVTANLREWRHIFSLRVAPSAHPQMRELMIPLLVEFKQRIPVIFDDIHPA